MTDLLKPALGALALFGLAVAAAVQFAPPNVPSHSVPARQRRPETVPPAMQEASKEQEAGRAHGADETVSPSVVDIAAADSGVHDRDAVLRVIRTVFPDLPTDVAAGWSESYRSVPLDELTALLLQKKELASLMPVSSMLLPPEDSERSANLSSDVSSLNYPAGQSDLKPVTFQEVQVAAEVDTNRVQPSSFGHNGPAGSLSTAFAMLRTDIVHVFTCGYRRHTPRSFSMDVYPSESSKLESSPVVDLSTASVKPSDSGLHLAIDGQPDLMFRLEPGCLLTRCGRFQRLDDGKLGIRLGDRQLHVFGEIQIPSAVTEIYVQSDGAVIAGSGERAEPCLGQLQLARVTPRILQESQGIYFTAVAEPDSIRMVPAKGIVAGALEGSNVNAKELLTQIQLLRHLENSPAPWETQDDVLPASFHR
ncbi:MAG: hypothetical protein KDA81_08925 [Planctomycetaceae bacterium]|nr:hypothetical protein [Planctomycetaceae bacterium]